VCPRQRPACGLVRAQVLRPLSDDIFHPPA
jgi:hypothetical protein